LISITSPAIDLTIKSGEYNALAVVNGIGGAGNVVLLSDTPLWKDPEAGSNYSLITGDNQLLLENIVRFTIPEPATVLLLGLGGLFLRKRQQIETCNTLGIMSLQTKFFNKARNYSIIS